MQQEEQNEQQAFDARRSELRAELAHVVRLAAVRAPNSPALRSALILQGALHVDATAADPDEHVRMMAVLASAARQLEAGATELDLDVPRRDSLRSFRDSLRHRSLLR